MKTLKYLSIFILILISFNCSEDDKLFNSPYDSDNDPDKWKPKDLKIQQINITNIKLDWDQDAKDIDGFKIDRKIGSREWENEIITVNNDKKECIDTTAIPDSLIYYSVYAYAGKNNSNYIADTITTDFPAPTNISCQLIDDQSVSISWKDNCSANKGFNEDGYKIERKIEGGNWEIIASVSENTENYVDDSLSTELNYFYRVNAYFKEYNSNYTNEISLQTEFSAPTNLSYQLLSDQSVKISWNDNCSFESGYKIERKLEGENYTLIDSVNANITEYTDNSLTYGETYYYRVKAFTNINESDYSSEISVQTVFPAPTNLSSQLLSDQSVKISWNDNYSFESGYKIERKLEGENYTLIDSVNENITNYTNEGLTLGETYYYRIKAFTNLNESDYTSEISVQTVFPAPTNLSYQLLSDQSAKISWSDNCSFESGFKIERKLEGGNYTLIDSVVANITEYTDDSLTYGETYYYRIKAFTDLNESDYTSELSVKLEIPAPTNLSYQVINDQSIEISWQDNCSFASGYKIERKAEGGTFSEIGSVTADIEEYIDNGLIYGETYYYRIKAFTNINESDYSSEISVQTVFPAPTNLSYQLLSDQSAKISWNDNCSFESGYKIERKAEGGTFSEIGSVTADIEEYIDNGLIYGETYYYRIKAFTNINESDYSSEISVQTVFPAPTNLSSQLLSDQSVKISWNDNYSYEDGYKIERKTEGGSYTLIDSVSENITNYTDEGLNYGETYYYRVKAYTDINESDYSNELLAQTEFPAPTNLSSQLLSDQSLKLSWTDNCSFEDGYKIERKTGTENYTIIASVNENITEYTDEGLTLGETYYYRIKAYTNLNESDYTNELSVQTEFSAPTSLSYQVVNDQSVEISWNDNCSFEDGYKIERKTESGDYALIDSVNENITNYTDEGLNYGETYYYRVKAYTDINESDYSNELLAQTEFPAPTNLSYQLLSDQSVKISWNDNCSFESGYKIERKLESGNYILIDFVNENITEYTDTELIYGETYYYRIKAFTNLNESDYSNEISLKTEFSAPTSLSYQVINDQSVEISWTDNCSFESGYKIERKTEGGSYTLIDSVSENITNYTDTELTYEETYIYRVKAYTDLNNSDYSNETNFKFVLTTFQKTFGGADYDIGYSVQETSDNGFIITGVTESYGAGEKDIWLIKTDQNGNEEWNKTFGGSDDDEGYSVQETSDGGFIITGYSYPKLCLIKTNENGDLIWNKTFDFGIGTSVQETSDGGFIITGSSEHDNEKILLLKTDVNGDEEWDRKFWNGITYGYSVQETSDGGFIITGYSHNGYNLYLIKTNSNGDMEWEKIFDKSDTGESGYSVQETTDGGFIITGYTRISGDHKIWLIKTDENGNMEWDKTFGEDNKDYDGNSVQETSDGGFIITGTKSLIKTDENGNKEWDKDYYMTGHSVQETSDGGFIITGYLSSSIGLIKTDQNGNVFE